MRPAPTLPADVLIVAPTGSDARNIDHALRRAGFAAQSCSDLPEAIGKFPLDAGALLFAEEALNFRDRDLLAAALEAQPPWSDLPLILITSGGAAPHGDPRKRIGLTGNLMLVERPLHTATLVATVDVALRSRRRQFELRDLLAERERLLASLEERVAERTSKLQAMVTEMEAFSYSVSHDLRSPLRVLSGYARVLQEDHAAGLDPEGREYLERIARSAERMDRLTQDLLAYTRVASGGFVLVPVDLDELVETVIESYPSLREARAQFHVRRPLGTVCGHAPSLVQCFSNLLDNALKFAVPGRPARVEVMTETHAGRVLCQVRDDGLGIDLADQARIFGLFERASGGRVPGTGVGLAIVKKAVERMKGTVGLESARGQGSRFWFELQEARSQS